MRRLNVGICIFSEQKGFFLSVAKILARKHNVWIITRERFVQELAAKLVPELSNQVIVKAGFEPQIGEVIEDAVDREKKYGEYFSMLISLDRGLGQGYLFNAEKHPHVIKSTWPHKRKIEAILGDFRFYEHVLETSEPDLVLGHDRPPIFDIILRHHGKKFLSLGIARISDRYIWFENYFEENESFTRKIKENLNNNIEGNSDIEYGLYNQFLETQKELKYIYSTRYALKRAIYLFLHEVYARVRRLHKKDGYVFCGWIPYLFRGGHNYRYVLRGGKRIDDLTGYNLILFALHQEPESSLLNISPEFTNSMEIIAWVSKSLPANALLVVKENPWGFGVRSKSYYKRLAKIPNVVWAHPDLPSLEWIKNSKLIVVISGTVGIEGVYYNKPVLSFGAHQVINHLPTVRYVNNFFDTRKSIANLMALHSDDQLFDVSKYALHRALMEVSFSVPGYERLYKSSDLHLDAAQVAVDRLYKEYAEIFN